MAVIDAVPGLRVTVQVNGRTAHEYDNPYQEVSHCSREFDLPPLRSGQQHYRQYRVIKYIEAIPGASIQFRISKHPKFRSRSHHIAARLSLDGELSPMYHETDDDERTKGQSWKKTIGSFWTGNEFAGYRRHSPRFTSIDDVERYSVEPDELDDEIEATRHCGTLKMTFFHMRKGGIQWAPLFGSVQSFAGRGIAEGALTGTRRTVDCVTSYDSHAYEGPCYWPDDRYRDYSERPFAVFEFRYRTRAGLLREHIRLRPSLADMDLDENVEDEIEHMSDDEVRDRLAVFMKWEKEQLMLQQQAATGDDRVVAQQPSSVPAPQEQHGPAPFQADEETEVKQEVKREPGSGATRERIIRPITPFLNGAPVHETRIKQEVKSEPGSSTRSEPVVRPRTRSRRAPAGQVQIKQEIKVEPGDGSQQGPVIRPRTRSQRVQAGQVQIKQELDRR